METDVKPRGGRNGPWLRLSEVAEQLGVSTTTAYRWAAKGFIPTVDLGGPRGRFVPRAALEAMLREGVLVALEDAQTRRGETT